MSDDSDRTASLMTPAKLAQLHARPQPAATPAAWLDQMAADAGSGHVRRLADLRGGLEQQLRARDAAAAVASLQALAAALQPLDFGLLAPRGWLARATGKGKEAAAGFVAQVDRIGHAGEDLADAVRGQQRQQAQAAATERTLVELEVELRAIDRIMEQGARWLQDMRGQIKARLAEGGETPQTRQDAARCELLVARLKLLRAAATAGQQAVDRCRAAAKSRVSVTASLQQVLEGEWKGWQGALAPVADEATASGSAQQGVEAARAAHQALQRALQQSVQDCAALAAQESAAADEVGALQIPLQAAA